jgi:hypothetical protein
MIPLFPVGKMEQYYVGNYVINLKLQDFSFQVFPHNNSEIHLHTLAHSMSQPNFTVRYCWICMEQAKMELLVGTIGNCFTNVRNAVILPSKVIPEIQAYPGDSDHHRRYPFSIQKEFTAATVSKSSAL